MFLAAAALDPGANQRGCTVYTTAERAHTISREMADRADPVCLTAVTTYFDAAIDVRHAALFVHDSSGSIFVVLKSLPAKPFTPGTLLEIRGVTANGDFAPVVGGATARVVGMAPLPSRAEKVSLSQLMTGEFDGHWVEIEGVARSVLESGGNIQINLAMSDGSISATTLADRNFDFKRLVDARISIRGNEAPIFNNRGQMTGVRLFFPGISHVKVLDPAPVDPFGGSILPVNELLRYSPNLAFRHRVHVRGRVSFQWPGRLLCVEGSSRGLCVDGAGIPLVTPGDLVDFAGFPAFSGLSPTLQDIAYKRTGSGSPVAPPLITAPEALQGDYDNKLIQIEGTLIGKTRTAKDPTLVLSAGSSLFPVVLPEGSPGQPLSRWEEGSGLRVTGICSVQIEPANRLKEGLSLPSFFRILVASPNDIVVVKTPSWWNSEHLLFVLASLLVLTLGVLWWVMLLRNRIASQTSIIQKQNATLQELSFHDGLTGIANRRKFDLVLETGFRKAAEASNPISLLLADIDYFKVLNDQHGHQRGDEVLIQVAQALSSCALRTSDLVARYGGEEFAAILTNCDADGALAIAERMRCAILDLGIAHNVSSGERFLSVSVGAATVIPGGIDSPAELIARADQALYESKLRGRNRTTCSPCRSASPVEDAVQTA